MLYNKKRGDNLTIAIIEDEEKIRNCLKELLEKNNYKTLIIEDFENCVSLLKKTSINAILLDINLPHEDGFSICQKIKKVKNVPILFVTSRTSSEDELKSIQVGGIDFITKPYNQGVLLEKIKRATIKNPFIYKEIIKNDYTLDLSLSLLKYHEKEIELTRNEFRILYYFFTNENRTITKEELLENLWNDKYYLDENILTVNINRLRKKAKEIGIDNFIKTVRGCGYSL